MRDTAEEVRTNSLAAYSCRPLHIDNQRQDDQLEPIYNTSVPIQDVALKTYRKLWILETCSERGSGRSVLSVRHDHVIIQLIKYNCTRYNQMFREFDHKKNNLSKLVVFTVSFQVVPLRASTLAYKESDLLRRVPKF